MNILVVSYFPLGFGGAEVSMKILASGLKKLGHNIVFASTGEYEGFKTYKFRRIRKVPLFFLRDFYLKNFLSDVIKKENINIIHSNGFYTATASYKAAKKTGIKCVAHFRDYAIACVNSTCLTRDFKEHDIDNYHLLFREYFPLRWVWEFYKWNYIKRSWKIIKKFDLIVVNSNPVKKKLDGILRINSLYVPNPVDAEEEIKEDINVEKIKREYNLGRIVVLYATTLQFHKGSMHLLRALKDYLKKHNDVTLLFAGEGELYTRMKSFVEENKLHNVKLLGFKSNVETARLYKVSDIVVSSSLWQEPLPRVLLDALKYRKPCIATAVGGNVDIIDHNFNGFLVNKESDWPKYLDILVRDKKLREKFGNNGMTILKKRFDVNVISKNMEKNYKKLFN